MSLEVRHKRKVEFEGELRLIIKTIDFKFVKIALGMV